MAMSVDLGCFGSIFHATEGPRSLSATSVKRVFDEKIDDAKQRAVQQLKEERVLKDREIALVVEFCGEILELNHNIEKSFMSAKTTLEVVKGPERNVVREKIARELLELVEEAEDRVIVAMNIPLICSISEKSPLANVMMSRASFLSAYRNTYRYVQMMQSDVAQFQRDFKQVKDLYEKFKDVFLTYRNREQAAGRRFTCESLYRRAEQVMKRSELKIQLLGDEIEFISKHSAEKQNEIVELQLALIKSRNDRDIRREEAEKQLEAQMDADDYFATEHLDLSVAVEAQLNMEDSNLEAKIALVERQRNMLIKKRAIKVDLIKELNKRNERASEIIQQNKELEDYSSDFRCIKQDIDKLSKQNSDLINDVQSVKESFKDLRHQMELCKVVEDETEMSDLQISSIDSFATIKEKFEAIREELQEESVLERTQQERDSLQELIDLITYVKMSV